MYKDIRARHLRPDTRVHLWAGQSYPFPEPEFVNRIADDGLVWSPPDENAATAAAAPMQQPDRPNNILWPLVRIEVRDSEDRRDFIPSPANNGEFI
jgi:hypothetical protein